MEFNKVLQEHRKKRGLTQEQLSEKLFVSSKTISNWETGKTTPDISNVIRVSEFFQLSLIDFLKEDSQIVTKIDKNLKLKTLYKWSFIISVSLITFSCLFLNTYQYKNALIDRFNPFMKMEMGYTVLPKEVTYNGGKKYSLQEAKENHTQIPDSYKDIPVLDNPFGETTILTFSGGQSPEGRNFALVQHKGLYVRKISFISWDSIPAIYRDNMDKNYEKYLPEGHTNNRKTRIITE